MPATKSTSEGFTKTPQNLLNLKLKPWNVFFAYFIKISGYGNNLRRISPTSYTEPGRKFKRHVGKKRCENFAWIGFILLKMGIRLIKFAYGILNRRSKIYFNLVWIGSWEAQNPNKKKSLANKKKGWWIKLSLYFYLKRFNDSLKKKTSFAKTLKQLSKQFRQQKSTIQ